MQFVTRWPLPAKSLSRDPWQLRGLLAMSTDVRDEFAANGHSLLHVMLDLASRRPPIGAMQLHTTHVRHDIALT